ncbi:hypothetical protein CASFOL_031001 [Castilleja foliolosa]|uniref:Uncharacterized protein n=1 Tax=Castilleja foliolosa TaxID=1961234 RepID=A0ABD3C9Y7_9LAMI
MAVPPWLERLLDTSFFNVCWIHIDHRRSIAGYLRKEKEK